MQVLYDLVTRLRTLKIFNQLFDSSTKDDLTKISTPASTLANSKETGTGTVNANCETIVKNKSVISQIISKYKADLPIYVLEIHTFFPNAFSKLQQEVNTLIAATEQLPELPQEETFNALREALLTLKKQPEEFFAAIKKRDGSASTLLVNMTNPRYAVRPHDSQDPLEQLTSCYKSVYEYVSANHKDAFKKAGKPMSPSAFINKSNALSGAVDDIAVEIANMNRAFAIIEELEKAVSAWRENQPSIGR